MVKPEPRTTKTFTAFTAGDKLNGRCNYIFPSGIQCYSIGHWKCVDSTSGTTYPLCHNHANLAKALDAGTMTSSGSQKGDKVLPATLTDDGGETESSKDLRVRGYTGAFNTHE